MLFIIDTYKFVNEAYYVFMIAAGVMVFLNSCFAILTFVICYFKMKKNPVAVNSYNIVFKEIKETHSKSELKKIIKFLHKFIFKNDVANFNKLLKNFMMNIVINNIDNIYYNNFYLKQFKNPAILIKRWTVSSAGRASV